MNSFKQKIVASENRAFRLSITRINFEIGHQKIRIAILLGNEFYIYNVSVMYYSNYVYDIEHSTILPFSHLLLVTKLNDSTLQTFQLLYTDQQNKFHFMRATGRQEGTIRTHNKAQLKCGVVGKLNTNKSNYLKTD